MTESLRGSVGQGGRNYSADVRRVYQLFNQILPAALTVSDQAGADLIRAIRRFQSDFMRWPDGRIDVDMRTWRRLNAAVEEAQQPDTAGEDIRLGNSRSAWVARYQWNDAYEAEFSAWVEQLFANPKGSLEACLRDPQGNSLYEDEDSNLSIYSDCADLPYHLRAYFSYKKKLPFSFNSSISGGRYTTDNRPRGRLSFLNYASFARLARGIANQVHSGFYRFLWSLEQTDTYPCRINRQSVVPGTVYYEANGHVLVVSRVEDDGSVWFVDTHPDNSLTTKRFGSFLSRGSCKLGGGFRRWRPLRVNASNEFVLMANRDIAEFDAEKSQCEPEYRVDGVSLGYHAWVRRSLIGSGDAAKINPLQEMQSQLRVMATALQERADSVEAARSRQLHLKPHPGTLPYNIFGAEGEWQAFSTPGRDARLKAQFREIHHFMRDSVADVASGRHIYQFDGSAADLVRQYNQLWDNSSRDIRIDYADSDGNAVSLTLAQIMDRLFALSFDPYHCPELRWGDTQASSCGDGTVKRDWYEREQRLRNVIDPDHRVNTTLDWGPSETPDIHIGELLNRLTQQHGG